MGTTFSASIPVSNPEDDFEFWAYAAEYTDFTDTETSEWYADWAPDDYCDSAQCECEFDDDCPAGYHCEEGGTLFARCVKDEVEEDDGEDDDDDCTACQTDEDCQEGETCIDNCCEPDTGDQIQDEPAGAPGFELFALLVAIGVVLIILRRKK
jgi:hypothetical protein